MAAYVGPYKAPGARGKAVALPTREIAEWSPRDVRNAILSSTIGSLARPAQLTRAIRRDPRVRGVFSTRTLGMLGLSLVWEGEEPEDWYTLAPEAELDKLLSWGLSLGVGIAQVLPNGALEAWDPQWLRQDTLTRQWYLQTLDGELTIEPGNGWIVYTPYGACEPWIDGLWTCWALPWVVKQFAIHDRARASEVFGSAMVVGKTSGASEAQRKQWLQELRQLSRSTRVVLPEEYDLELIEAQGQTWGIYGQAIDWANEELVISTCGQLVTTEGQTGFSRGDIHQAIAHSLIKFGAETFSTCLGDQYIQPTWGTLSYPKWNIDPPSRALESADALKRIGEAITKLEEAAKPAGYTVDVGVLSHQYSLPLKKVEAAVPVRKLDLAPTDLAKTIRVDEARASQDLPPVGGERGNLFISELDAVNAAAEEQPVQPTQQLAASARSRLAQAVLFSTRVDIPVGDEPPVEFRILAMGENRTDHGPVFYNHEAGRAIIARMGNRELMIDLEHLSLDPEAKNYDPDARGWARLDAREDGLYAVNVRWTPDGDTRIRNRTQKWISPVLYHDKKGNVTEVFNAALTALPAMRDIAPLAANRGNTMKLEQAKAALEALQKGNAKAAMAILSEIIATAASGGESDGGSGAPPEDPPAETPPEPESTPQAAPAPEAEEDEEDKAMAASAVGKQIKALTGLVTELVGEVKTLSGRLDSQERDTLIASREMTPALRKWADTANMKDLRLVLNALPEKPAARAKATTLHTSEDGDTPIDQIQLSPEERQLAKMHRIPEEAMLNTKREQAKRDREIRRAS